MLIRQVLQKYEDLNELVIVVGLMMDNLNGRLETLLKFLGSEFYRINFKLACDALDADKIDTDMIPQIKKWLHTC